MPRIVVLVLSKTLYRWAIVAVLRSGESAAAVSQPGCLSRPAGLGEARSQTSAVRPASDIELLDHVSSPGRCAAGANVMRCEKSW